MGQTIWFLIFDLAIDVVVIGLCLMKLRVFNR